MYREGLERTVSCTTPMSGFTQNRTQWEHCVDHFHVNIELFLLSETHTALLTTTSAVSPAEVPFHCSFDVQYSICPLTHTISVVAETWEWGEAKNNPRASPSFQ